jgi:CzcA family heavy metal efflux pump
MKITEIALDKSLTVYALMVIVVFLGAVSYLRLPRESAPDVKIPFVMVYAPYYGTSPSDMEKLVTRKLEKQLKGLDDVKEMTSTSSEGASTVVLEFTPDVDMSDALQKVRDAIELAKPELPDDTKEDLIVQEISASDWPIMQIVLSGDYSPILLRSVAEDLQEEIEQIAGVLGVDLTGGIEQEVRVDVDPERLRFYGLGLPDVIDAIALENVTIPGGDLALGTYEYQVRVPGEFETVAIIEDIVINVAAPTPVYIRDVAEVSFGIRERDSISRLNGVEAVTLSVKKRSGENIVRIAEEVQETLERTRPSFPEGTRLAIVSDESEIIDDMVNELENNILSGLILVVVCLFLFLGLTNSFFVGAAIPFSMLISFLVLRFLGITLNMVVLFSLILALGMLVDNAVVVVENIYRHRTREGMGPLEAARRATAQVASPVVASTITTICAFGPLVFWPGIMGEFMKYLPITVIVTLSASLLVALVFNPVLCARFMRIRGEDGDGHRLGDRLLSLGYRSYEPVIRWALRHRVITLGGVFLILAGTFALFGRYNAGVELFPDTDPTYAFASLEAPSGTRIELSNSFAGRIEEAVDGLPDLKAYVAEVGTGGGSGLSAGGDGGPAHLSRISIEFIKREYREQSSRTTLEGLRDATEDFTGAKLVIDKREEGPPTGPPVNIEISGEDFPVLGDLAAAIRERIRDVPGLVDLQDDYDRGRPELQVRPDLDKAARLGLRTFDVANTIRTAIHGTDVSEFRQGEDEYDIVVRLAGPARRNVEDVEELTVFYEGENIPLGAFADVSFTTGLGAINRIDAKRVVTVSGDVRTGYNGNAVLAEVQKRLKDFALPSGYSLAFTGETEDQEEAMDFLTEAYGVALMLILVVLITQFNSVTSPFVIMSSVLLSLIGVLWGLMATQTAFGIIMTGVGVISLAGVVVNNAIVLIHYIILLRRSGMEKMEAIVEGGRTRFRPVILTAVTTILGLVPLTTGFSIDFGRLFAGDFRYAVVIGGESSQWWGPMGVAVIWGLAVATFLTLVVVPVMYSTVDPVLRGIRWILFGWWQGLILRRSSEEMM